MRKNLADAQRSSELKGKRSPARNTRNPEIITNVEILQVAKALPRVQNNEGVSSLDSNTAKEVAMGLLLHFQYMSGYLYDLVSKDPFRCQMPKVYEGPSEEQNSLRVLTFQKYCKGIVLVCTHGDPVEKLGLIFEMYNRKYEGKLTWKEAEKALERQFSISQEVLEDCRCLFDKSASPCITDKDINISSEPSESETGISIEQFAEMVNSIADRVKVSINLANMVTDVRRYETAEATRLFSDL